MTTAQIRLNPTSSGSVNDRNLSHTQCLSSLQYSNLRSSFPLGAESINPCCPQSQDAGYGTPTDSLPETSSVASSGGTLRVRESRADLVDSFASSELDQDQDQDEFEVTVDYAGPSSQEPLIQQSDVLEFTVPSLVPSCLNFATPRRQSRASNTDPVASFLEQIVTVQDQDIVTQVQEPLTLSPEPVNQIQEAVTQTRAPNSPGTLEKLRQLASVKFSRPTCPDTELADDSAFPSLPNSRLEALGLLPGSLAELQAANSAVSIVDSNCRYRMEGPPEPSSQQNEHDEPDGQAVAESPPNLEDRVRELEISFANDASTLDARAKRVSLARASLELNLQRELDQLEARLVRAGEPEMAADVRVLRDTASRLSSTAEVVGAIEQECRLNFAFHLVHKFSDEMRSEKERMSSELELLRQAVEEENFYFESEAKYSKFGTPSKQGRSKFQQLGHDVAKTSSVTSLMQRLARERQRRKRLAADEASQDDVTDGTLILDAGCDESTLRLLENEAVSAEAATAFLSAREPLPADQEPEDHEQTVLDKLDQMSAKLYSDRRVRLFIVPAALLIAIVFLLWAIAYPFVKRVFA